MSSSAPTMAVPPPPASAAQHDDGHCKVHAHIPTMNRTETFKKVTAASGQTGDEAQRIVELLRHWDSDKDGLFSVENVLQAAQTVLKEQRRNRMLRWVVVGVLVAYIVTLALLLGITYGAIEMAKDAKPDEDAVLRATHLANKDVVRTKSKVDVWSPFDVVDKSLADMEKVDAFYLGGLKTPDGKHEMERYYKVQQMERIVDVNALQVTFQGGDILEIFSDGSGFARLLTPNTKGGEKGCGEKGMASENGKYCIIGFIRLHDDVDAAGADDASKNKEGARLRKLPASSRLAAPGQSAYNTGPKGIGNNLFVNSGKAYQGDVFKINRDLFFGLGQLENHGSRVFG